MMRDNLILDDSDHVHDHHQHEHGSGPWDEARAESYVKSCGEHATNRMTVELDQLVLNDIVVDIGCGSGEAVRESALRVTLGRAIGLDPTPAMIRRCADERKRRVFDANLSKHSEGEIRMFLASGRKLALHGGR